MYRLLCAALSMALCSGAQAPSALDKPTMERYVRHIFAWGPAISVKVSDPVASGLPGFKEVLVVATAGGGSHEEKFLVSPDGKKIVRGVLYDVAENPFAMEAGKIKTDRQPAFGPANAPVVVVIYSDFQCSYCRAAAKVIRENIASTYAQQVRVYFKDFPLEAIHPWAKPAAIAGRCIFEANPPAFWTYHDWIFENQEQITVENFPGKLTEFAKANALAPDPLSTCLKDPSAAASVNLSMAEAQALNVNSTPTLFINGRRAVGNLPWPQLKAMIDHEIDYAKESAGAAKCCEVKVPTAVSQ